jgi:CHASE2 domain-containing sensor protein
VRLLFKPAPATVNKITSHPIFAAAVLSLAAIGTGLALWTTEFGARWDFFSYDCLFRFATRPVTNQLVILHLDTPSLERAGQVRGQPWNRALHTKLLERLAADGCPLVVFDVWFGERREAETDKALADAMKQLSNVVLMAWPVENVFQPGNTKPGVHSIHPLPPADLFLDAAGGEKWGVGSALTNSDGVVRRHWRFPSPGLFDSLAWTAARVAGAELESNPRERWIRYYEPGWAWTSLSYVDGATREPNFFRDKIVFIGNKPANDLPDGEPDEFSTPFTKKAGGAVSGVEILATEFLNLVNGEWLERPPAWIELLILVAGGIGSGTLVAGRRRRTACLIAVLVAAAALIGGVSLSYFTDFWFPWMIVAGGQVPVVLAVGMAWPAQAKRSPAGATDAAPRPTIHLPLADPLPALPDYDLIQPAIGEGAYGKVWLARNAVGQWQALKVIYRSKFGEDGSPYEREFRGIERYKRISDGHPGLLRIDFVSRMRIEGYFYYVMELGDAACPGWEQEPARYRPLDLAALCATRAGRLPARECARIGARLCDALHFLHSHGLAHRDIKPRNVIFVNGHPKLADVGLVADVERPVDEITWVGTLGFMPPPPEPPGTAAADIYGLGMLLYVVSTGARPQQFPELSTTLVDRDVNPEFRLLTKIIFKACHPDRGQRYATALEMRSALLELPASASAREAGVS